MTRENKISPKGAKCYISILKLLFSHNVNFQAIHNNYSIEIRNRISSLLESGQINSWSCLDENDNLIAPQNEKAMEVFDQMDNALKFSQEVPLESFFKTFSDPPFGMNDYAILLMIAVVFSYEGSSIRLIYQDMVLTVSNWVDVIIKKDSKCDFAAVKKSLARYVDSKETSKKFIAIFSEIQLNKKISAVPVLEQKLNSLLQGEELPAELENQKFVAQEKLSKGKAIQARLDNFFETSVEVPLSKGITYGYFRDIVAALYNLKKHDYNTDFVATGFLLEKDPEMVQRMKDYEKTCNEQIDKNIDSYLDNEIYCQGVSQINEVLTKNKRLSEELSELGFVDYADEVSKRTEKELSNPKKLKARQDLLNELLQFNKDYLTEKGSSYRILSTLQKRASNLQKKIDAIDKTFLSEEQATLSVFQANKSNIDQGCEIDAGKMNKVYDNFDSVTSVSGLQQIVQEIDQVLALGLKEGDEEDFRSMKEECLCVIADLNKLSRITSRDEFGKEAEELKGSYSERDFDFDVLPIVEEAIHQFQGGFDAKENAWKKKYLVPFDGLSIDALLNWKNETSTLPSYLSERTIEEYQEYAEIVEEEIHRNRVKTALYYYDKLTDDEKAEFLCKVNGSK